MRIKTLASPRKMATLPALLLAALLPLSGSAQTAAPRSLSVSIKTATAQGEGPTLGTVRIVESDHGLVFHPTLNGLSPGLHGFHVHEKPSCAPAANKDGVMVPALGAGGHYDPGLTGKHGEPWGDGHLGDLPALFVAPDGTAGQAVLAPRLKRLADVMGRSLMVHAGGDNHADHPAPLGGGGARVACGLIADGG